MANPIQNSFGFATHLNQGLFSDYYLDQIVPTLPEWNSEVLYPQVKGVWEELRALLATVHPETLSEAQLEERWVKPVLEKLGHQWSVQVQIRYRDSHRKPDYVFTATAEEARAFTNAIYNPAQLSQAIALGDAKKWGVNLDQTSKREGRNPSQQIDEYLRYSEIPWGILTDGRYWRLYERNSSKDNSYYAVDLLALLTNEQGWAAQNFYYFYLFFRREAFEKSGWLDTILQGSVDYAETLSDQLEDEVYEALRLIAEGFLRYRRNRLAVDAATLRTIYEQSLVLLYRLLFIFYVESRGVFLLDSSENYGGVSSLTHIKKLAAEKLRFHQGDVRLEVDFSQFHGMLNDLFFIVDEGSAELDVPPYNGQLFSGAAHPFLDSKKVGDKYLIQAIDRLARVPDKRNARMRVFVDYRDLDVRHLGAIYEKLLEYHLDIAEQPLTAKGNKYVPAGAGDKVEVQAGEVYLRTGNNERKITGSYYTPDYIVRFIVEQTLEPLLTAITRQYADLDAEQHWIARDPEALRKAILNINVLDPATGSGHFMVEAVNYIAEWLRQLSLHPDDMAEDEDELVYWKRQVVTTCIYGVDVNPLAVELAKLSLWLATIARGKPLSFLDHHVKLGNSLVGARVREIGADVDGRRVGAQGLAPLQEQPPEENGQMALFDEAAFGEAVREAVGKMETIEHTIAAAVSDVKVQEKTYEQLRQATSPLRLLADVWTARHFGLALSQDAWKGVYEYLTQPVGAHGHAPLQPDIQSAHDKAQALAGEHHFFHWELEFPEVFFDAQGKLKPDGGFDAVIGNPPYVRQERIQPFKPYLEAHYQVYQGTADLFLYFYERALELVRPSQRVGYITSGTYMNSNSATSFRRYLHQKAGFEAVVNFGENQPFRGAEMVYPTIAVFKRDKAAPTFRSLFVEDVYPRAQLGEALRDLPLVDTASDVTALDEWRFQSVELTALFKKITQGYQTLGQAVNNRLYSGIKTGLGEAFVIDEQKRRSLIQEHPSSEEIIRPFLLGQDLRPWYQISIDSFLIAAKQGINIDDYPAVKRHLVRYQEALAKRSEAAAGSCQWYELRPCSYYDEFSQAKIFWPDIGKLPRFSWDDEGFYNNDKGFFVIPSSRSLLAILNSRVFWFALSQIATPLRLRAGLWQYQAKIQFVERLPIPELSARQQATLAALAEEITGLARGRYQLHEAMRRRIRDDLGGGGKLNTALESWWELDFPTLRAQVQRAFRAEIPLKERDEWERYLHDQRAKHEQATAAIVERETRLNAVVYEAFKLTAEEIGLIEQATKYPYGAV